jgi:L-2-amino-thiazoline-4-carboxylic acid hydrolase
MRDEECTPGHNTFGLIDVFSVLDAMRLHVMDAQKPQLPLLDQREIEARIVGPLVRAFASDLGNERALAIVGQVVRELARQSGGELARILGEQTLVAFAQSLDRWRENGALEIDIIEQSPEKLSFNVTRCRYAEMYRALGLADLGGSLSCQRDYALAEGFNPAIQLVRTQTIMEGASHCDFRFRLAEDKESAADIV